MSGYLIQKKKQPKPALPTQTAAHPHQLQDQRASAPAVLHDRRDQTGLPSQLKAGIASLSGMNLDQVKVHYNSPKPAMVQAHAYTQGREIHVAPGQAQHLPHEAWHVVQQAQGRVKPTQQVKPGVAINDNPQLEREADVMGQKALQRAATATTTTSATTSANTVTGTSSVTSSASNSATTTPLQRAFDAFGNWIPDFEPQTQNWSFDFSTHKAQQSHLLSDDPFGSLGGVTDWPAPSDLKAQSHTPRRNIKQVDTEKFKEQRRQQVLDQRKQSRKQKLHEQRYQSSDSFREIHESSDWEQEINSKNPDVLKPGIYKPDWYLMPYEDILAEESEAVMTTLQSWFPHSNPDTQLLQKIYTFERLHETHPLVKSFNPGFEDGKLALRFSINPSYVKYLDASGKKLALRLGGGTQAISGLADHKTDVLFEPQTISVNGTSTEVGKLMHARRLSQDHPLGMTAGKDSKQKKLMEDLAKTGGSASTMYIKGHLLNDHLGGPARTENLFPITHEANGQHVYWMEKYVKAEVAKGYVMEYTVEVPSYSISPSKVKGTTRNGYTINASFKCHSARLDVNYKPIDNYNITIVSTWGAASKPLHNHTTAVDDPSTLSELTNKLASGTPNKAKENPDIEDVDKKKYAHHKVSGYNQDIKHKGKHSDFSVDDHTGALPFSLSGSKSKVSAAKLSDLESVVGKHKAKLIYTALKNGSAKADKKGLLSISGIGPKTVEALDNEFELA